MRATELPSIRPKPARAPCLRKSLRLMLCFFEFISSSRAICYFSLQPDAELANLHIKGEDLFLRMRFPDHVARHAVDFRQGVQGNQRRLFHQDAADLLQQRNALFFISGPVLLVDQTVDLGILETYALGSSGPV